MYLLEPLAESGNITAAIVHLELASKTPGSPQLNTFGPGYRDLRLIKELLTKGKKQPAIDFFERSKTYWKSKNADALRNQWEQEIQDGKVPEFPYDEKSAQKDS